MTETTISIEDMKAELEVTGKYRFYQVGNEYFVNLPEVWHVHGREKLPSLIERAYQHYQREKRYAEMEALIERIADLYGVLKYSETQELAEEAKKLLIKP